MIPQTKKGKDDSLYSKGVAANSARPGDGIFDVPECAAEFRGDHDPVHH